RLCLWLIATLLFGAAPASADALPRVGTVDVQAVLTRSAKGISAKQVLSAEKDGYQAEMDRRRQEIEVLRDEIEKSELSPGAKDEKRDQLDRHRRDAVRRADHFT